MKQQSLLHRFKAHLQFCPLKTIYLPIKFWFPVKLQSPLLTVLHIRRNKPKPFTLMDWEDLFKPIIPRHLMMAVSFSRPVEEGICTENNSYSTLVSTVGASNNYSPYGSSAQVKIYYDDYAVANWYSYSSVYPEHTNATNVKGRVTGVETKMLESSTWLRSVKLLLHPYHYCPIHL